MANKYLLTNKPIASRYSRQRDFPFPSGMLSGFGQRMRTASIQLANMFLMGSHDKILRSSEQSLLYNPALCCKPLSKTRPSLTICEIQKAPNSAKLDTNQTPFHSNDLFHNRYTTITSVDSSHSAQTKCPIYNTSSTLRS